MARSKKPRIAPFNPFLHRQSPSPTTKDIGQLKRVMFTASEKDSPVNCRLEGSCIPSDREKKVTKCADNDPKTSEYAFFKKLKKDAGLRFHSRQVQKDVSVSKKPEPTDFSRESIDHAMVGCKGFNTSRITEERSPIRTDSYLQRSGGAWNKSGNHHVHGEIFRRKRQKLHQCVGNAFCLDTEKFCLKGHDIVSLLLSRLFPMNIKEYKYEDLNPGKEVNTAGYDLLDSRESDVQFEELDQIPSRKLQQSSSYFSDKLLSPMLLTSDESITAHSAFPTSHSHKFQAPCSITEPACKFGRIPNFDVKCDAILGLLYNEVTNATGYGLLDPQDSDVQAKEYRQIPKMKLPEFEPNLFVRDHFLSPIHLRSIERIIPEASFPTSHSHEFQPLYSVTEPECYFDGIPSFTAKSDETLKFLFNEQEQDTFALDHFKDLEKLRNNTTPLQLERYFDGPIEEINLPIAYCPKPEVFPSIPTLGIGEEKMLRNILGECHFSPSSSFLDKPQEIASILDSGLLRYQEFRFGKYVYSENDDMDMNINHTILPMSHNKHHFELSRDRKFDASCVRDSFFLLPHQHWITRSAYNDNHLHQHPDSEAWLSSSLGFISGQRCLSLTSSHPNYQGSTSMEGANMSSPFQSKDRFEPEMDAANMGEVVHHFRRGLIEICNSSFLQMSMERQNGRPLPLDDSDYINELEQTHNMIL